MADPTLKDLQDSIEELQAYRSRLRDDVIAMGKKLKLPQKPTDDLFSRIKGKTFKLTIVNQGYGPEIVAMKLCKQ